MESLPGRKTLPLVLETLEVRQMLSLVSSAAGWDPAPYPVASHVDRADPGASPTDSKTAIDSMAGPGANDIRRMEDPAPSSINCSGAAPSSSTPSFQGENVSSVSAHALAANPGNSLDPPPNAPDNESIQHQVASVQSQLAARFQTPEDPPGLGSTPDPRMPNIIESSPISARSANFSAPIHALSSPLTDRPIDVVAALHAPNIDLEGPIGAAISGNAAGLATSGIAAAPSDAPMVSTAHGTAIVANLPAQARGGGYPGATVIHSRENGAARELSNGGNPVELDEARQGRGGTVHGAQITATDAVEMPDPQLADLITSFLPCSRASLDYAIDRFLDPLDELGSAAPELDQPLGLLPASLAVAASVIALDLALRVRQPIGKAIEAESDAGLRFPGLPGLWRWSHR